jgi:hypothetical protein
MHACLYSTSQLSPSRSPPPYAIRSEAIIQGGGILDKVSKQWDIFAPDGPPGPSPLQAPWAGHGRFPSAFM